MTIAAGKDAERTAEKFLQNKGLRILARNYRCRRGEIDLVAEDGGDLVFVEVRRRKRHSSAAESIDARKRARLTAAAMHYLCGGGLRPCRFDAVLVDADNAVQWLRSAFDAEDRGGAGAF